MQFYPTSTTPPNLGTDDSGSVTGTTAGTGRAEGEEGVEEVDGRKGDEEGEDVSLLLEKEGSFSLEETKDLLISFLFVIKYVEDGELFLLLQNRQIGLGIACGICTCTCK